MRQHPLEAAALGDGPPFLLQPACGRVGGAKCALGAATLVELGIVSRPRAEDFHCMRFYFLHAGGQHIHAELVRDGTANLVRRLECRPEKTAAGQLGL
jgi:hypothetical protein